MCKQVNFIKKLFANIVWPSKLANVLPFYVFSAQIIDGNCIFSSSLAKLANMPQGKQIGKHTPPRPPPAVGGLIRSTLFAYSGVLRNKDDHSSRGLEKRDAVREPWVYLAAGSY